MTWSCTITKVDEGDRDSGVSLTETHTIEPPSIFRDELGKMLGERVSDANLPRVRFDGSLPNGGTISGFAFHVYRGDHLFTMTAKWERGAEIMEVWAAAAHQVARLYTRDESSTESDDPSKRGAAANPKKSTRRRKKS